MSFLLAHLLGWAAAVFATCFPGMLNMSAVSTSLRAGRSTGYRYALGLAFTFCAQAGVALVFADYLAAHPGIVNGMKQWAIVIFVALAAFFIFKGYRAQRESAPHEDEDYTGSPFGRGAFMAFMNFLTLPYFFALGGWLLSDGYLDQGVVHRILFSLGAGGGALLVFGAYVRLADWIRRNATYLTRNINFILGGLFVVLALVQGIRLFS